MYKTFISFGGNLDGKQYPRVNSDAFQLARRDLHSLMEIHISMYKGNEFYITP